MTRSTARPLSARWTPIALAAAHWLVRREIGKALVSLREGLALYLAGPEVQKMRALNESNLPTIQALYDDADIAAAQPIIPQWKDVFLNAVPRPSAPTLGKYNEVSSKFWSAVHETLSGNGSAADNLAGLEADLTDLKGDAW